MGKYFIDQYSLLHFAFGGIWRYYGLDFVSLLVIHIIFEYVENTTYGMKFINIYFPNWPGGKTEPDTIVNSMSDIILSLFGYLIMDRCYQYDFCKNRFEDFCLGTITFFWYFKKYGWLQSIIALAIIYYIIGNNLFFGFIISYIVDYYGTLYNWVGKTQ